MLYFLKVHFFISSNKLTKYFLSFDNNTYPTQIYSNYFNSNYQSFLNLLKIKTRYQIFL